jgi:hypothetical protein
MRSPVHLQLLAAILIVAGIVAFAPRLQCPHLKLSVRSSTAMLSGAKRFVDDSSQLPDLEAGCKVQRASLPEYLNQMADDQAFRPPSISSEFGIFPVRPLIRRFTLRPARSDSPIPL